MRVSGKPVHISGDTPANQLQLRVDIPARNTSSGRSSGTRGGMCKRLIIKNTTAASSASDLMVSFDGGTNFWTIDSGGALTDPHRILDLEINIFYFIIKSADNSAASFEAIAILE